VDVEFHPAAGREVEGVVIWYLDSGATVAASQFLDELTVAISKITAHPERYPKYLYGTRRYVLNRFPHSVVYRVLADHVLVIAVAAARRRPGYWRRRRDVAT